MYRRRNYFIKKEFQMKFSGWFIALLLLESALIAGLFLSISKNTVTTGYADAILTVQTTRQFFFTPLLFITLIVVVGIGTVGLGILIFLSHRIAGPLFRFEQAMKQLENGDLSMATHLRKSDQLGEFKESLNRLIVSLDQRMSLVKATVEDLEQQLQQNPTPELLAQIRDKVKRIKDELNHFKVTAQKKK